MAEKKQDEKTTFSQEEFIEAYNELCTQMGYQISVNPVWIPRDDGSWSMIVQTTVGIKTDK